MSQVQKLHITVSDQPVDDSPDQPKSPYYIADWEVEGTDEYEADGIVSHNMTKQLFYKSFFTH